MIMGAIIFAAGCIFGAALVLTGEKNADGRKTTH